MVLILVGLLPMVLVMAVTNRLNKAALEKSETEKIEAVTKELKRQVAMLMDSASNDLAALASNDRVVGANTPEDKRIEEMRRLVRHYKRFDDITVYDSKGIMVSSTTDVNHPEPFEATDWFASALKDNRRKTSPPHRVLGQKGLHLKVYIPIEIAGYPDPFVLRARLTFGPIEDMFNGVRIGGRGRALLIDSRGDVIAGDAGSDVAQAAGQFGDFVFAGNSQGHLKRNGESLFFHGELIDSEETAVEEPWALVSVRPRAEILAAVGNAITAQSAIALSVLIGAACVGLFIAKQFAKPIVTASEAAMEVSQGKLDTRVPEHGATELRLLAKSFNAMVDEVRNHRYELEGLVDSRTQKLRDSQRQLENIYAELRASYEAAQDGILVVGEDGNVIAANQRVTEFFGIEGDVEKMSLNDFRRGMEKCFEDAGVLNEFLTVLEGDEEMLAEDEWQLIKPQARSLSVYSAPVKNPRGRLIARLWTFSDITEQRNLQRSLEQAQKMEAVGRLAGGVAHDFNNLLTGIIGNLSLVGMEDGAVGSDAQDTKFIESAKRAGERAAELVKKLLGFSRQSHLDLEYCDANEVIEDVNGLLSSTLDRRITIIADCKKDLWSVKVDATQVEQVVMNMCVNAKDAMESDSGTITLSTRNEALDRAAVAAKHPHGRPGDFVVLTIEDDGSGMPPEVLAKIFEPFFTTKEQGKGTGLGLATSYGIVHQHGGWIECDSRIGKGTKFSIYLPREERVEKPTRVEEKKPAVIGGEETLLLVDDEEVVRSVAEGILGHHGYDILTAADGLEALEVFEANRDRVKLVLLDLTMPKLSGKDTLAAIRERWGDVPVVVCSGYLVDLEGFEEETGYRPQAAVQKPYNIKDLARKVREVIDAAPDLATV